MSFAPSFGTSTPANANFSFGAAGTTTSTPVKPAGFGQTPFGFGTPATSVPTVFGTPATQASGFANTSTFGAPASVAGFGSTSTATVTSSTPATNFGFGTGNTFGTTSVSSTGFGSTISVPTTTAASIGGFGGFGGFGTTATTAASNLFAGFGTTAQPSFAPTSFGGFGAPKPAVSTPAFANFGIGSGFSNFGTTQQQQQQQQQQQFQQQPANSISEALYNAVFNCQLFNDERDNTIARWNLIQALWGTGRAYYSRNNPPIELNQENPLCRFKAIGYNRLVESDNNEGLVALIFNKKEQEVKDGKQQIINSLTSILGNSPNLMITIDSIISTKETKCQVTIFVSEKSATGTTRKIPANELVAHLSQNMQKTQLAQMSVEDTFPKTKPNATKLKEYLENPPCSIDPRLWKQAQLENPYPNLCIPVPMIGFEQIKHRLSCQEEEAARHKAFIDMAAERIQDLQRQHTATQARLKEHKRTLLELQHRVLQVLSRQEITRKVGLSLQPEEEVLTNRLEAMHSQISAPTQFKGRISEMLSQLRMRRHVDTQNQERYTMDPIAQDDIKLYLSMEQQGMSQLIDTINVDLSSLQIIKDGMSKLLSQNTT